MGLRPVLRFSPSTRLLGCIIHELGMGRPSGCLASASGDGGREPWQRQGQGPVVVWSVVWLSGQ